MPHLSLIDPEADDADAEMASVLTALAAYGLHLPADTDRDNLMERIRVAGHNKVQEMHQGNGKPKKPRRRESPSDEAQPKSHVVTEDARGRLTGWRE